MNLSMMQWKRVVLVSLLSGLGAVTGSEADVVHEPYHVSTPLESRSVSFENPSGERGNCGQAASKLGVGRKGSPACTLKPGETIQLADIQGRGTLRHLWITTAHDALNLRSLVVRVYWEKEVRVTIQQIGWKDGLYERQDDWSCATFWYEPVPSAPLPDLPDHAARTANLWAE
jgi:hypothetical protein